MQDLIERLEKATGPDWELDAAIAISVLGWTIINELRGPTNGHQYIVHIWHDGKQKTKSPNFTASIDAALTLVPEGYRWLVGSAWKDKHGSCPAMASVVLAGDYGGRPTSAATPAVALCIAALKARASGNSQGTKEGL